MNMADEIGFHDFGNQQQHLFAFYTTNSLVSESEIRAYMEEYLPGYMIPSYFKELQDLPLTSHGKVDYDLLEDQAKGKDAKRPKYVSPRNDIESYLAQLWANFLQLEKVSVLDNFIALGGHSIVAIRILARIERDLNIKIPLTQVFEHATVAEMASYLEQKMEEGLNASGNSN